MMVVDLLEYLSGSCWTGMITASEDAGGAGEGGNRADPFATMLEGLPGFIAEDIAALLRDLPLPACAIFHYRRRVIFQE